MSERKAWIGVDFDGTIATYNSGDFGSGVLGDPIAPMVERVKRWLAAGKTVKIFTARVADNDSQGWREPIEQWCEQHIGQKLEVTNVKDWDMVLLFDDRAIMVGMNTGTIIGGRDVIEYIEDRIAAH